MSKNDDRTLSGSTEISCDILDLPSTINAIRIKNNTGIAGQVLAKNVSNNKIEWAAVPIADDTIETDMIKDLAVTDDKIANNTITGSKLNPAINLNTTGALTVGGITTLKGLILFNNGASSVGTFVPATGVLQLPNGVFTNGISVGTGGELVIGTGSATFGASTTFGGELSMATGGSEVFNMNSHNLTNGGDATFNSLTLNTALTMTNIDLDLGTGDLTADNASFDGGAVIIDGTGIVMKVGAGLSDTITLNHTNGIITCKGVGSTGHPIDSEGGEIRSGGGLINTENGNLNVGSGTYTGTGAMTTGSIDAGSNKIETTGEVQCGTLDAGTIEGPTTLSGVMNVGYGAIDSATNNGQITGYGGSLSIRLDNGAIACSSLGCSSFTSNGGALTNVGVINSDSTHNEIYARRLHLSDTSGGIVPTSSVVFPTTLPIKQFDIYSPLNDIPRILACKSFTADHSYTRSITGTYKNIDKDTTTLNVAFTVPPSCKVIVEVGFYVGATLNNERLMLKLVNSTGAEFFATYINDANHGFTTENMECQFAGSGIIRGQTVITKFFLSFPTSQRLAQVNLQPQAKVSSGTVDITTGGSSSGQTPPMYVKVESSGTETRFNWHMETSSGGDDY